MAKLDWVEYPTKELSLWDKLFSKERKSAYYQEENDRKRVELISGFQQIHTEVWFKGKKDISITAYKVRKHSAVIVLGAMEKAFNTVSVGIVFPLHGLIYHKELQSPTEVEIKQAIMDIIGKIDYKTYNYTDYDRLEKM